MNYGILWRNCSRNCIIANVTRNERKRKSRDFLRIPFESPSFTEDSLFIFHRRVYDGFDTSLGE